MNIPFNPVVTNNASGTFNTESTGYVQGTAQENPSARNQLAGGVLASTETLPLWGGVGIYENIPGVVPGPSPALGGTIGRATNVTAGAAKQLTGFAVFDQQYHMIQTPQSQVPLAIAGQTVAFYRLRSLARIVVACSPELVSLDGSIITSQVSWDFGAQKLGKYNAAWAANVITAAAWSSSNGGQITYTTTTNHGVGVGVWVTISGFTPSGYNGTFLTLAGTATDQIVVAKAVDPGADTVQGTLEAGGGALAVNVLEIRATNNMIVEYDTVTGAANWNRNGCAALIELA